MQVVSHETTRVSRIGARQLEASASWAVLTAHPGERLLFPAQLTEYVIPADERRKPGLSAGMADLRRRKNICHGPSTQITVDDSGEPVLWGRRLSLGCD